MDFWNCNLAILKLGTWHCPRVAAGWEAKCPNVGTQADGLLFSSVISALIVIHNHFFVPHLSSTVPTAVLRKRPFQLLLSICNNAVAWPFRPCPRMVLSQPPDSGLVLLSCQLIIWRHVSEPPGTWSAYAPFSSLPHGGPCAWHLKLLTLVSQLGKLWLVKPHFAHKL